MNNLLVGDTWQMNLLGDTVRERKSVTVAPVTLGHQVTWILLKSFTWVSLKRQWPKFYVP